MLFRRKRKEDEYEEDYEEYDDEYEDEEFEDEDSYEDDYEEDDEYVERPRGSGLIIFPILVELLFAGLLYLKDGTAALNYLYALIPLLLATSLTGTYVYNHDGDMKLFSAVSVLTAAGVAFQILADETYYSTSYYSMIKTIIGFFAAIFFVLFYRVLRKLLYTPFMTWAMLIGSALIYVLLLVKGIDPNGYGTYAWISIGGYTIQMTDLTKIAGIFFYASLFSGGVARTDDQLLFFSNLFMFVNAVGSVMIHELGSLFILFFLHLSILYIFMGKGKRKRTYLIVVFFGVLAGIAACFGLYKIMRPYAEAGTMNSLMSVLWPIVKKVYVRFSLTANIQNDPFGAGYQLLQGKKALWTAGLFGNTVNFTEIPLAESDMAFPALVSQFGFIIGLFVFLMYLRIFISGSEISRIQANISIADSIVIYGASVLIFLQAMIVILGSCNLIPFTGLPIPFLSRGGTYQMIVFCFAGLLLNMSENNGAGPLKGGYDA